MKYYYKDERQERKIALSHKIASKTIWTPPVTKKYKAPIPFSSQDL